MAQYGLLIDYEYCTNCGSCQVTCQEEHDYPVGETGIKVMVDGPWKTSDGHWNFNNWPVGHRSMRSVCFAYGKG